MPWDLDYTDVFSGAVEGPKGWRHVLKPGVRSGI